MISRGKEGYVQSQVNDISTYFGNKGQANIRMYADDEWKKNIFMLCNASNLHSPSLHLSVRLSYHLLANARTNLLQETFTVRLSLYSGRVANSSDPESDSAFHCFKQTVNQ
jgi:hypothetical protein